MAYGFAFISEPQSTDITPGTDEKSDEHPVESQQGTIAQQVHIVPGIAERTCAEILAAEGQQLTSVSRQTEAKKGKPGPKPNFERARRVAEIVQQVTNGEPWKPRIDEICDELDEAKIPFSMKWRKLGTHSWTEAAIMQKELVKKAITYHLKIAGSETTPN
jgi:hypothetical protein